MTVLLSSSSLRVSGDVIALRTTSARSPASAALHVEALDPVGTEGPICKPTFTSQSHPHADRASRSGLSGLATTVARQDQALVEPARPVPWLQGGVHQPGPGSDSSAGEQNVVITHRGHRRGDHQRVCIMSRPEIMSKLESPWKKTPELHGKSRQFQIPCQGVAMLF